jgi:hypothetical protein
MLRFVGVRLEGEEKEAAVFLLLIKPNTNILIYRIREI